MKTYNWAVLGCGVIANQLAQAMNKQGRHLYAVGNRTREKAVEFALKYKVGKIYDDFHEMFTDPAVDIIYITTPHNTHLPFLLQALTNGKHVLCEKAITLNSDELKQAVETAKEHHVVLAEAMTLFHMPLYKELEKLVRSGELGPLRLIQMNFGSYKEYDMHNRFFNRSLAGGALLDIGVYAISFVRWFMSETPGQITSQVKFAPTGVDEQAGILLMNDHQEMAALSLSLHAKQPKRGTVVFDQGFIEIMEYPRAEKAVITYTRDGSQRTIEAGSTEDALLYEILDMEKAVSGSTQDMHLDYTIDVMDIMSRLRRDWNMKYPEEETAAIPASPSQTSQDS